MLWREVFLLVLCTRLGSTFSAATTTTTQGGCCQYKTGCRDVTGTECPGDGGSFNSGYTCVGDRNSGTCVLSTTLMHDPILTTFDNQTLEFTGESGRNYSLLSGETFHLNMQLVAAGDAHIRHQGGEGTFVGGLSVLLPLQGHSLVAQVDEAGNMTFSLNNEQYSIEAPATVHEGLLSYEPYAPGLGQVLTLKAEPFIVQIVAVKRFNDSVSGYNRGHFDLRVELTSAPTFPLTGVLWETLSSPRQQPLTALEEVRYEVPFLDQPPAQVQQYTRRLLTVPLVAYPTATFASIK